MGRKSVSRTYGRGSRTRTPDKSHLSLMNISHETEPYKSDVAAWVDSVIVSRKSKIEPMKPNNSIQILSDRFSDITPNVSMRSTNISVNTSQVLGVSPMTKINIVDNIATEQSESILMDSANASYNMGSSLRSTRKQVGRALASLNTSNISQNAIETNDDSILVDNNGPSYLEESQKELSYKELNSRYNESAYQEPDLDDDETDKSVMGIVYSTPQNVFRSRKTYQSSSKKVIYTPP